MALSPSWVEPEALGCSSCHGQPPPAPHPQITDCSLCHGEIVADDDETILEPLRHVDGNVDFELDMACNSCHGDTRAGNKKNQPVIGEKAFPEKAAKTAKLRKKVTFKTAADVMNFV